MTPDYQQLAKQEIEKYSTSTPLNDKGLVITLPFETSRRYAAQAQQGIINTLNEVVRLDKKASDFVGGHILYHKTLKEVILNYKI